jgi:hypothetical protein
MARSDYIAVAWSPQSSRADETARLMRLRDALEAKDGWHLLHQQHGLWIFGDPSASITIQALGVRGGVILGDVFDRQGGLATAERLQGVAASTDVPTVCCNLAGEIWGRYLALLPMPQSDELAVFRDPMAGLESVVLRQCGVTVVASTLPQALLQHLAIKLEIDWSIVGRIVANPVLASQALALRPFRTVPAGAVLSVSPAGVRSTAMPHGALSRRLIAASGPGLRPIPGCWPNCPVAWTRRLSAQR